LLNFFVWGKITKKGGHMAKKKVKKGQKLACVPCGREIIVDCCGSSTRTIWCCGKPMKKKSSTSSKKAKAKHIKRKK
jgi:hypothetical protein